MGMFYTKTGEPLTCTVSFRFVEEGSPGSTFHKITVSAGADCLHYPSDCSPAREGWNFVCFSPPSLQRVQQDEVVDAHYERRQYTVTFLDESGEALALPGAVQTVRHGEDAAAPDYRPAQGKRFCGWDGDLRCITTDQSFRAKTEERLHSVYFLDGNGKVIGAPQRVAHAQAAAPPMVLAFGEPAPPDICCYHVPEGRRFTGWSRSTGRVTDDIFCVALTEALPAPESERPVYAVTFCDEEGLPLEDAPRTVKSHCAVMPPTYSPRCGEGWVHTGWSAALGCVTQDMVVRATVAQKEYPVRFLSEAGKLLSAVMVRHGENAPLPQIPHLPEGCVVRRWQGERLCVTEPRDLREELERETYYAAFYDKDGYELEECIVAHGTSLALPAYEAPEGWHFIGWRLESVAESGAPRLLPPGRERLECIVEDCRLTARCEPDMCCVQMLDLRDAERPAVHALGSRSYGCVLTQADIACLHLRGANGLPAFRCTVTGPCLLTLTRGGVRIFDMEMQPQAVQTVSLLPAAARDVENEALWKRKEA
ncbi:MAG: hypothetical protein LBQ33_04895 [Oscillospiraceae bacterium]|jgi:hypothetical protein|nr:hypothetical protein [Oscillospiraceae bacterium]